MAWVPHSDWFERMMDGTDALDLDDAVGGDVIKIGIVTETAVDPDTAPLFSGLTAVGTATAWTGPVTLASKTCGLDGSNDVVFDAADIAHIAQAASGLINGRTPAPPATATPSLCTAPSPRVRHAEGVLSAR